MACVWWEDGASHDGKVMVLRQQIHEILIDFLTVICWNYSNIYKLLCWLFLLMLFCIGNEIATSAIGCRTCVYNIDKSVRGLMYWCKNSPRLSTQFPTHHWHPAFVCPIQFSRSHTNTPDDVVQTVAQHSAESRPTDPLHTITSRTHDCQNTPRAISFSAA